MSKEQDQARKPRLGIYVECDESIEPRHQRTLDLMSALKSVTSSKGEKFDMYVFSSQKEWKRFANSNGMQYRPIPTSGVSNRLGRRLFGQDASTPKPPEWFGDMLNRKIGEVKIDLMIFTAPSSLIDEVTTPIITVLSDLEAHYGEKYSATEYSELYASALSHSKVVLADNSEDISYLGESFAKGDADLRMVALDEGSESIAHDLTPIIRMVARGTE